MIRMPHISAQTRQAGFSLVELLAVLTIMALVLGAVTLRTGSGVERVRLDALARHVSDQLNRARMEAIRTNRQTTFTMELADGRYGAGEDRYAIPEGVSARLVTARRETSSDTSSGMIRFFPDGTSTGGTVELERQGRLRLIHVDWLTGHVRLEKGAADE